MVLRDGDAVDASAHQHADDRLQVGFGKIGSELHHDRAPRLAGRHQLRPRRQHARQQIVERRRGLQVAQARRVGRGDVDAEVAGDVVEAADALDVVGRAIGRILVGPDVDADDAARRVALQPRQCRGMTAVVEAEPVDKSRRSSISRKTRGRGLPCCGRGVTVPISAKPSPMPSTAPHHARVLVEARGDAERIGEREAPRARRQPAVVRRGAARIDAGLQRPQRQLVRLLRIEGVEQRAGQVRKPLQASRSLFCITCEMADRAQCAAARVSAAGGAQTIAAGKYDVFIARTK